MSSTTLPTADASHGSRQNPPTLVNARSPVLSIAAGAMVDHVSVKEVRSRPVIWYWAARGR